MDYAAFTWDTAKRQTENGTHYSGWEQNVKRQRTARQPGKKFRYFNTVAVCRYRLAGFHVNAALNKGQFPEEAHTVHPYDH